MILHVFIARYDRHLDSFSGFPNLGDSRLRTVVDQGPAQGLETFSEVVQSADLTPVREF